MSDQILTFVDLQRLCRPGQHLPRPSLSTVVKWANREGIRFLYDGQGGVFTTLQAVNAALGTLKREDDEVRPYSVEELF